MEDPVFQKLFDSTKILNKPRFSVDAGLDCLASMNHGRVIPASETTTDGLQRMLCHLLTEVHSNLACINDRAFPALADQ